MDVRQTQDPEERKKKLAGLKKILMAIKAKKIAEMQGKPPPPEAENNDDGNNKESNSNNGPPAAASGGASASAGGGSLSHLVPNPMMVVILKDHRISFLVVIIITMVKAVHLVAMVTTRPLVRLEHLVVVTIAIRLQGL